MNIHFEGIYFLNPDYILRHDYYRSFIVSREKQSNNSSVDWSSMIHPAQAMIFSFFTKGLTFFHAIQNLSEFIGYSFDEAVQLILPYIENKKEFFTSYDGEKFEIPKNLIIQSATTYKKYSIEDFYFNKLDFKTKRMFSGPMGLTFMVSNTCATNCIYCYANTTHKVKEQIPFSRIKEIIKQAYDLNISDLGIIGGEMFLYPFWKELLTELTKYGFYPDIISTKLPIKESDMLFLKSLNMNKIQISFDSYSKQTLARMLKTTEGYKSKMINTLQLLSKHKFDIQIAVTLTKYNSSATDVIDLLNFLSSFEGISEVNIGPAFYSLYKNDENFNKWGISKKTFEDLISHVNNIKHNYKYQIEFDDSYTNRGFFKTSEGSPFFTGAYCSAIRNHLFILPDGKVTICEQLYWNERFIVGDLTKESIVEVWNSQKSLMFANLKREYFRGKSICRSCEIFEECHENVNKCWADILKAYGDENWDFPDPRCAFAPRMINNITFDLN